MTVQHPEGLRYDDWLSVRGAAGRSEVPLLFLDVDGTVRHGADERGGRFVNSPADVVLFPEVVPLVRDWRRHGGRVVLVSNQAGVPARHLTLEDCVAAMYRTQELAGWLFDLVKVCVHPLDAGCWCRKPQPGMVVEAALELEARHPGETYPPHLAHLVGDRSEDERCAQAAGIGFEWAADWRARAVLLG